MEIATATAPQTTLPKLQLVRNAWLVNLLAAVTLFTSAIFVGYLRMQAEAEVFVLIGVAGSAYMVLQCWSFLICTRALRQEERFLSPYLALVVSLLLFNAFILGIALSTSLSIHPLREGLYPTALPVIIPVCSVAILLMLPIMRILGKRWPLLSERRRTLLHFGVPFLLVVLLLPIPLFIYVAQFVSPDEKVSDSLYGMWGSALPATPEFVANAALKIAKGTRFYPRLLSSGCPSLEVLAGEATLWGHPNEALRGLRMKNPEAAVASALGLARTEQKAITATSTQEQRVAVKMLLTHLSRPEMENLLLDPRVSFQYRDEFVTGLIQKYRSIPRATLFEMGANPDVKLGPMAWTELHHAGIDSHIEKAWPEWIGEPDPNRADRFAQMFGLTNISIRNALLEQCLSGGSNAMQTASLRYLHSVDGRGSIDAIFKRVFTLLENIDTAPAMRPLRVEAYLALNRLNGKRSRNLATDDATINTFVRATRARLDALKNSASQLAPAE